MKDYWPRFLGVKVRSRIYKFTTVIFLLLLMLSILGKKLPWSKVNQQTTINEIPGTFTVDLAITAAESCSSIGSEDPSCIQFNYDSDFDCYSVGQDITIMMTLTIAFQILSLITILSHKKVHISYKVNKAMAWFAVISGTIAPAVSVLIWNQQCHNNLVSIIGYLNPGANVVDTEEVLGP